MKSKGLHPILNPKSIKAFRKSEELSQQELATLLGVGVATVSRWERGTPPTGTAALILRILIAGPHHMTETSLFEKPRYDIYQLLKKTLEPNNDSDD